MSQNPFPPPVPTPEKKGIPAIGWLGIGCGAILLILVIGISLLVGLCRTTLQDFQKNPAKAAAEMIIRANPDLELVDSDDANQRMTVRTKDGKEMTFTYDQIREGRFSFTDGEGNTAQIGSSDLSKVPSWVPRAPGVTGEITSFHNESGDTTSGFYTAASSETADAIEAWFSEEAGNLGLTHSNRSVASSNDIENRTLRYSKSGRELTVNIASQPGSPRRVQVGYSDKK